jgi:hypothetical protein
MRRNSCTGRKTPDTDTPGRDAAWFADHPGAVARVRRVVPGEIDAPATHLLVLTTATGKILATPCHAPLPGPPHSTYTGMVFRPELDCVFVVHADETATPLPLDAIASELEGRGE